MKVETKDFGLILNYETGDFLAKIDIGDTRLNQEEEVEFMLLGDGVLDIEGNIPIMKSC